MRLSGREGTTYKHAENIKVKNYQQIVIHGKTVGIFMFKKTIPQISVTQNGLASLWGLG